MVIVASLNRAFDVAPEPPPVGWPACRRSCADDVVGVDVSPLLSNVYMRRIHSGWKVLRYERRFQGNIVN